MSRIDLTTLKFGNTPSEAEMLDDIRSDLEDSLKEYSELDLIVELLQNAVDACDERRYRQICEILGVDHASEDTISAWNRTVDDLLLADYESFPSESATSALAVWQAQAEQDESRRRLWAEKLVENLSVPSESVDAVLGADLSWAALEIEVDLRGPKTLTIRDAGVGIENLVGAFRHKGSTKRRRSRAKRRGIRGSHGWGLSAVLGMSDRVEVVTRTQEGPARGIRFERMASFRKDPSTSPEITEFKADELTAGLPNLAPHSSGQGTTVSILLPAFTSSGLVGALIEGGTVEQWATALRLYTPIGQVNDYVLNPSYHCLRKSELDVRLRVLQGQEEFALTVPYDYLRLKELGGAACVTLKEYVDGGMQSDRSVFCVGRRKAGETHYLLAAEIQASKPTMAAIEAHAAGQLVDYQAESGEDVARIPRGIFLALSGGMRSEFLALAPTSTFAAFRGIVLSETAEPTLGRKHTLDQRTTIPRAAKDFARQFEQVRKHVIPSGQPVMTGPALNQWQRKLWRGVLEELEASEPIADMRIWSAAGSGEARVMLAYAELLARDFFGDCRVLRCSLQDVYDFEFVYHWKPGSPHSPTVDTSATLTQQGYCVSEGQSMRRLAIGEFKNQGHDLLGEFDPTGRDWRKNPNSIDLLVCWDFDDSVLGEAWTSQSLSEANPELREFEGQTHVWVPQAGQTRSRNLAVCSLSELVATKIADGNLAGAGDWSSIVGGNYYD